MRLLWNRFHIYLGRTGVGLCCHATWLLQDNGSLAGGNSTILLCSSRKLGKWSNLISIFQMGWFNQQLDMLLSDCHDVKQVWMCGFSHLPGWPSQEAPDAEKYWSQGRKGQETWTNLVGQCWWFIPPWKTDRSLGNRWLENNMSFWTCSPLQGTWLSFVGVLF